MPSKPGPRLGSLACSRGLPYPSWNSFVKCDDAPDAASKHVAVDDAEEEEEEDEEEYTRRSREEGCVGPVALRAAVAHPAEPSAMPLCGMFAAGSEAF